MEIGCALCGTTRSRDWVGCERIGGKVVCIDCIEELNTQIILKGDTGSEKKKGTAAKKTPLIELLSKRISNRNHA